MDYTALYRQSNRNFKHSLLLSYTNNKAMADWSSSTEMDVIGSVVPDLWMPAQIFDLFSDSNLNEWTETKW